MSMEVLRGVLDSFEEASCCSGSFKPSERVAIALPDGDVGAVSDANFVDWLLHHSEPAPYGEGSTTKLDPKVRNAQRLTARDKAVVHGFDPSAILPAIEAALSPGAHLDATLTDVIVYPKGGKFDRHKDTPRAKNLIGTLVVGLPIKHTGGAFHVDDGREEKVFDWSKSSPDALPWVALFADVDHEIKPVKSGTRVTLVYALHRSDRPRTDAAWTKRNEALRAACRDLEPSAWPLMIACGRHVIAEPDTPQPQEIDTLRGLDREIAEALVAAGYNVRVRACIAGVPNYELPPDMPRNEFPVAQYLFSVTRLNAVPPPGAIEALADEGGYEIEDYMHDTVPMDQWLVRKNAAATLVLEAGQWGEGPGTLGNEGYDALLYTVAAIEVDKAKTKVVANKSAAKATKKAPAKKPTAKKPAAKKPVAKKPAAKKSAKPVAKKPAKRR